VSGNVIIDRDSNTVAPAGLELLGELAGADPDDPIELLISAHSWLSLVPWPALEIPAPGRPRLIERAVLTQTPVFTYLPVQAAAATGHRRGAGPTGRPGRRAGLSVGRSQCRAGADRLGSGPGRGRGAVEPVPGLRDSAARADRREASRCAGPGASVGFRASRGARRRRGPVAVSVAPRRAAVVRSRADAGLAGVLSTL
jgi:hypothetical protein